MNEARGRESEGGWQRKRGKHCNASDPVTLPCLSLSFSPSSYPTLYPLPPVSIYRPSLFPPSCILNSTLFFPSRKSRTQISSFLPSPATWRFLSPVPLSFSSTRVSTCPERKIFLGNKVVLSSLWNVTGLRLSTLGPGLGTVSFAWERNGPETASVDGGGRVTDMSQTWLEKWGNEWVDSRSVFYVCNRWGIEGGRFVSIFHLFGRWIGGLWNR